MIGPFPLLRLHSLTCNPSVLPEWHLEPALDTTITTMDYFYDYTTKDEKQKSQLLIMRNYSRQRKCE